MVSNMIGLVMTPLTILLWYFLFFILLFKTWNVCVPIVRK